MENSRQIKFRAWHRKERILFQVRSLFNLSDKKIWINESRQKPINMLFGYVGIDIDLMQYTGRKDKNGKEIYEGSIISHSFGHWFVGFENGCFVLYHTNIKDYRGDYKKWGNLSRLFDPDMADIYAIVEVVGSISENPELLG